MTLVDTEDMLARTCRVCGAVVWDRVSHQRWHRGIDAIVGAIEVAHRAIAAVAEEVDGLLDHPEEPDP